MYQKCIDIWTMLSLQRDCMDCQILHIINSYIVESYDLSWVKGKI